MVNESASDKRLRVRETFNIKWVQLPPASDLQLISSVREQNLLSLAFHSGPPTLHGPIISMLSLSPHSEIQLNLRSLSTTTQTLHDLGKTINVVTPQSPSPGDGEGIDYGTIPFSCPGARHVIPAGTLGSERLCLVVGDEYSVLYSFNQIERREASQQLTSSPSPATSPRASAVNRSPQSEMKQIAKRRKSSTTDGGRWQIHPVWRVRQGFGTVLS
jgi:DNA damage-binding protein 1